MKRQEFWLSDPTVLFHKDYINELWPKAGTTLETKLNAGSRLIIVLTVLGYLVTMNMSFIVIGFITLAIIAVLYNINNSHANIGGATAALFGSGSGSKGGGKEGFDSLSAEDARRTAGEILITANRGMARRGAEYGISSNNGSGVAIHGNFTNPSPVNPLMNVLAPEIKYAPTRENAMPSFVRAVESQINESAKSYISTNFDASVRNAVPTNDLGNNQGQVPTQSDDESRDIYIKLFSNLGDSSEFEHSMRNFYATPNTRVDNDQAAFAKFCYGDMRSCKEGDEFACSRNSSRIGQIVGA
jgi:hypothetical protein